MSLQQDELRKALIEPRSVAIIGASDEAGKTAGRPLKFLQQNGFRGEIFPVNPRRETVLGVKAYPNLDAISSPIDHAFVVLPTELAIAAFEECARHGVKVVSILADGFAESGTAGQARQNKLKDIAASSGCRIVGPNSLGVVRTWNGLSLTANAAFAQEKLIPGRYTVLSQSGSLIGTFFSRGRARGIGFSNLISVGNEADLSIGEIGDALLGDPKTDAFLLFLETIRQPDKLAQFAERAARVNKPILAYKLGRSEVGAELAVSHTGAMVGSDAAADCFLRDIGIVRFDVFESLLEAPPLFTRRRPRNAKPSVTILTTTGGGGAMVADRLGLAGIEIREISAEACARLAAKGFTIKPGRIVDLTLAGTRYEPMRAIVEEMLASTEIDLLVVVVGSSAEFFPEQSIKPIADAAQAASAEAPPLAVFIVPHADHALTILAKAGVAAFRTSESCAEAIRAYLHAQVPMPQGKPMLPNLATTIIQKKGQRWSERDALELFAAMGIPCVRQTILSLEDAMEGRRLGEMPSFPLVAKLLSSDLPHKTEAGAVTLGIRNPDELKTAVSRMMQSAQTYAPHARIEGVLLQEQRTALVEAILGFRKDAAVGAVITLGFGGIFTEIYRDISLRRPPITRDQARTMIDEVKGFALLRGFRGRPRGDIDALADAIVRFSQIAADDRVSEAEINPLLVCLDGSGVVAVDGLVLLRH